MASFYERRYHALKNPRATYCPNGHKLAAVGTETWKSYSYCVRCRKQAKNAYRAYRRWMQRRRPVLFRVYDSTTKKTKRYALVVSRKTGKRFR